MPNYTIILNDEQQLALEYDTERRNEQQAGMMAPGGASFHPQTPAEVLQATVVQHLDMLGMQVQPVVAPLTAMLATQDPGAREALLMTLPRVSLQNYLRAIGRR